MTTIRPKLLGRLIGKKLYTQLDQFIALAEQGFDVAVQLPSEDLKALFFEMCETELRAKNLSYSVATNWQSAQDEKGRQDVQQNHAPLLYIGTDAPPSGSGFISFQLPALEQLLPSVNTTVSRILEHARLETYLDVFDAKKMGKIKTIASAQGLGALIDVVVQTAYLAGFSGKDREAEEFLSSHIAKSDSPPTSDGRASFTILIDEILKTNQSPHCYLKAALSYYVVRAQGNSMTTASRILNISRTTLQQHLLLAEKFRVYEIFEQSTR